MAERDKKVISGQVGNPAPAAEIKSVLATQELGENGIMPGLAGTGEEVLGLEVGEVDVAKLAATLIRLAGNVEKPWRLRGCGVLCVDVQDNAMGLLRIH